MISKPFKATPTWLGLDSMNGRYLTGTRGDLSDGMILPGETAVVSRRCYKLFKSERLVIKSTCAPSFLLRKVWVGADAGGMIDRMPMPAEAFAVKFDELPELKIAVDLNFGALTLNIDRATFDLIGAPFPLPTCNGGIDMGFEVENIGKEPTRFLGALLGQSV